MMNTYKIEPDGWKCLIEECQPGHFVYEGELCFKTEYGKDSGDIEVYCSSGEFFMPRKIKVQPVILKIEED